MNPTEAIKKCLKNYFNGKGRASRSEFWWFFAFYSALVYLPIILFPESESAGGLVTISVLTLAFPLWMVGLRRIHDVGMHGIFLLIPIVNLFFLATQGDKVANKYGEPLS